MKRFVLLLVFLYLSFNLSGAFFSDNNLNEDPWYWMKKLLLIPGVSGSEQKVADMVMEACPKYLNIQRDNMGNVWFTAGSGGPHLVFVAHTDEIGYIVKEITEKGTLKVESRGGFFPKMYEGRPVIIYTGKGPVNGVVLPRAGYLYDNQAASQEYSHNDVEIYLGVEDNDGIRELGISIGDQITIKKYITELSEELLCARGVDDRAGCAALLAAAYSIDWSSIKGKTITFAWDVQEEVGLFGAAHLAKKLNADYVFPVDTFVSSDGPLDEKRFACLPLGEGMVLRAIDSSSISPSHELKKLIEIARKNEIPIQLGNTRGGNDGSVFVPEGGVNLPLSWPGLYSHSFIEKIHKKDLKTLTKMIIVLVNDFKPELFIKNAANLDS